MEQITQHYLLSQYRELKLLGGNKRFPTYLVRSEIDGSLAIKKKMFLRQAEVYLRLQNCPLTSIPKVLYVLPFSDHCVVLEEYVAGESLEQKLDREKTLPENQILDYCGQLCDALTWLHSHGLIHRDINPSNIMVSYQGEVKLIDFDISRSMKPNSNRDTTILGTVGYAAPEQFGFDQTDSRTDLYSLGVLLNVMSTGYLPNQKAADGKLGEIVKKCTRIDPDARYQTAAELKAVLCPGQDEKQPCSILGFRSRQPWKMAVASFIYAALVLLSLVPLIQRQPPLQLLRSYSFYLFAFLLPFLLLSDFNGMSHRLFFLKKAEPQDRRIVRILLAISSVVTGLILQLLLPD